MQQSLSKFQWHILGARRTNSKMCMEPQKIPNSQNHLEKEEQSWKYHAP